MPGIKDGGIQSGLHQNVNGKLKGSWHELFFKGNGDKHSLGIVVVLVSGHSVLGSWEGIMEVVLRGLQYTTEDPKIR
jgi:hypothetical protein